MRIINNIFVRGDAVFSLEQNVAEAMLIRHFLKHVECNVLLVLQDVEISIYDSDHLHLACRRFINAYEEKFGVKP